MRWIAHRRPKEWLARPGQPDRYTVNAAATLLGLDPRTIHSMIREKLIRARRRQPGANWMIARSELVRASRLIYADRPLKLARILESNRSGRLLAVTDDSNVRRHLVEWEPLYASSLFDLGTLLCTVPNWGVVIDFDTVGTHWANDAALRIGACPDRPKLFAFAPEFVGIDPRPWDAVLERPLNAAVISTTLKGVP